MYWVDSTINILNMIFRIMRQKKYWVNDVHKKTIHVYIGTHIWLQFTCTCSLCFGLLSSLTLPRSKIESTHVTISEQIIKVEDYYYACSGFGCRPRYIFCSFNTHTPHLYTACPPQQGTRKKINSFTSTQNTSIKKKMF